MLPPATTSPRRPWKPWVGWVALVLCGTVAWLSGNAAHRRQADELARAGLYALHSGDEARGRRQIMAGSLKDPSSTLAAWGRWWLAVRDDDGLRIQQIWPLIRDQPPPEVAQEIYAQALADGLRWHVRRHESQASTLRLKLASALRAGAPCPGPWHQQPSVIGALW